MSAAKKEFFGYGNEAEMRADNRLNADLIVARAIKKEMVVCSAGKECVGSLDGKTFMYADGSRDEGRTIIEHRAEFDFAVFAWSEEVQGGAK